MNTESYALLGTRVDALTIDDLHQCMAACIDSGQRCVFTSHNLHSLHLLHHTPELRKFYGDVDYVRIDGMAVVAMGRILGLPLERRHRVTYVDWWDPFLREALHRGWRLYYVGSTPEVCERGLAVIRRQYPGIEIEGHHGYFDATPGSAENEAVLERIRRWSPQVLLVGMGMPRQQLWVHANRARLDANVISTCGAALDYLAGEIPTPPRWAGRVGLEWLFRLAAEPRRLARRYLIEPWFLLGLLVRERFGLDQDGPDDTTHSS